MAPSIKKSSSTDPGYLALIQDAIGSMKERNGSSRQAIDKIVSSKKGSTYSKSRLNIALKKGVESGKLVQVKGSFKSAAGASKKAVMMKKAVVMKKAVPKKKVIVKKSPAKKKVVKKPVKQIAKSPVKKKGYVRAKAAPAKGGKK